MLAAAEHRRTLIILMCTILLDFMAFLLVFPLFPQLFLAKHSLLVSASATEAVKYICYGLALASWAVGCFFGTAFLGQLSDKIGRKKVLMLGLGMVGITYLLQAFAIDIGSFTLFFVSRLVQGFFGGNYDIAQAAVADISLPEEKASNMGLMALAGSIGIVLGPLVSAFTTSSNIVSWFNVVTPFWVAAFFAFANILWIKMAFNETFAPDPDAKIKLTKVFTAFLFIFSDKRVVRLGIVLCLLSAGWGFYVQEIPIVLQKLFNFSANQLGLFFVVLGVGFALAMKYLQPYLTKHFKLRKIYIYMMLVITVALLLAGFIPHLTIEWVTVFIIAVCHVCGYGCLLAMLSDAVMSDEQGKVMGGAGAVGCLGFAITSVTLVSVAMLNIMLPIILAAIIYFISAILLIL